LPPGGLSWAVRQLAADARSAVATSVDAPSSVRFELPGGRAATWSSGAGGFLQRVERPGRGVPRVEVAARGFRVALPQRNLLSATWTDPDGRTRRVEIWLRHEGSS
jgi:hypothetical protein